MGASLCGAGLTVRTRNVYRNDDRYNRKQTGTGKLARCEVRTCARFTIDRDRADGGLHRSRNQATRRIVMLPKPELAYFAIADISGYTSFLARVELDHAQDIIADFMDTVVKGLRPPFRLAKFEGDAAFVYALAEKVDGSLLQDTIESAYFKFRRRLRDVKQASTCECKACVAMSDLDFKFVVHHGEMVKQKMGGREELAGCDPCP